MSNRSGSTNKKCCKGGGSNVLGDPDCIRSLSFGLTYIGRRTLLTVPSPVLVFSSERWCRAKREMHGLLNRIFAAFDGAKMVESPTLLGDSSSLARKLRAVVSKS